MPPPASTGCAAAPGRRCLPVIRMCPPFGAFDAFDRGHWPDKAVWALRLRLSTRKAPGHLVRRFFFIPIRPFPSIACFLFPSYCPVGERMHLNTKKRSRKKFMQKNLNELRVYNWNSRDLSVHWMLNEGHEPWRGSYSFIGASQFCGTHWALATPGSHPFGEHSIPNKT